MRCTREAVLHGSISHRSSRFYWKLFYKTSYVTLDNLKIQLLRHIVHLKPNVCMIQQLKAVSLRFSTNAKNVRLLLNSVKHDTNCISFDIVVDGVWRNIPYKVRLNVAKRKQLREMIRIIQSPRTSLARRFSGNDDVQVLNLLCTQVVTKRTSFH